MALIYFILSLVITGIIFGALGRLAVPGANPMGIGTTILVGIAGAFLGGVVGALLGAPPLFVFILEVLGAALIVFAISRRPTRVRTY
jgi:uncharacterized membrane protein YeaQ/YmgE (transglycosylase-associated protein family)